MLHLKFNLALNITPKMNTFLSRTAFLFVLFVAGCAVAPIKQSISLDESALQWATGSGSATITGSAFLKTKGGDVKVGAGDKVELIPAAPYTRERFEFVTQSAYTHIEPRDPRLAKYVRSTIADAQGNFEFRNIPAGEYFIACLIEWRYAVGSSSAITGGQAIAFVSVANDEVKKVVVTK